MFFFYILQLKNNKKNNKNEAITDTFSLDKNIAIPEKTLYEGF